MGGADVEAKQGAESEGQTEPTESKEHEIKEEPNAEPEPGESSEPVEGDLPEDTVRFQKAALPREAFWNSSRPSGAVQ